MAYCWGTNGYGESGYGPSEIGGAGIITPVAVQGGLTFRAIAVGDQHTCALTMTGRRTVGVRRVWLLRDPFAARWARCGSSR